jgi:hypothetical protein
MSPKVFVSHASEDKDRFVIGFATKLRAKGIDAWLDKWEMFPGDSLVDKIFEEGIKEAAAVIMVISSSSITKPWVREELNAAFVARVNKGSKLIPVLIDDCEVPAALSSTLWVRIADLSSYDSELDRIVSSVLGLTDKPPLGPLPSATNALLKSIGGLSALDSTILQMSCQASLRNGDVFLNIEAMFKKDGAWLFPEEQIVEALEILEEHSYVKTLKTIGGIHSYKVTTNGFEIFGNECIPDYASVVNRVISAIVNEGAKDNTTISNLISADLFVVTHVMDVLEQRGFLKLVKTIGGGAIVVTVSASLRRNLSR